VALDQTSDKDDLHCGVMGEASMRGGFVTQRGGGKRQRSFVLVMHPFGCS